MQWHFQLLKCHCCYLKAFIPCSLSWPSNPQNISILGVLHFIAVALMERHLEFRPLLYTSAGIVLGMIVNPYFPDNLIFSYHHMLPKLADATSVRVGNEW